MHRIDRLRRRPLALVAALMVAMTVAGATSVSDAAAAAPARAVDTPAECVVVVPAGARCGAFTVPVASGVPDSPVASLPYVVVPATLDTGRTPIVYLSGGTPLAALDVTALTTGQGLASDRDVVFLERRGRGDASPSLDCPPAVSATRAAVAGDGPRETRVAAVADAYAACVASWQEDGVAPSDFGATQAAADLRAVREQLGYPRWTILAVGVDAAVALAAPGVDQAGVDGVVLDGPDLGAPGIVTAAGVAAGLAAVQARSIDDGTHAREGVGAVPPQAAAADRTTTPAAAVEALDPIDASAALLAEAEAASGAGESDTARPSRPSTPSDGVLAVTAHALSDPVAQAALPYALRAVASGRLDALDGLTAGAHRSLGTGSPVQDQILACSAAAWPGSTERGGDGADTTTLLQDLASTACAALGVVPTAAPGPVAAPALVLSATEQLATLDGPAAPLLPTATVVSFPGAGAVPTATSACAGIALRTWLAEPTAYRAALCAVDDAAVPVLRAADVSASPRLVEQSSPAAGGVWSLFLVPLLFGVVSVGWSIAWAYRLITQALRRDPVQGALRLGITPVFGASWAVGTAVLLVRGAMSSPATSLLGVPAALPWLSVVLLVSGVGLVPVWAGAHRGSRLRVTAISLLWAATAAWTAVYVLAWW